MFIRVGEARTSSEDETLKNIFVELKRMLEFGSIPR